MRDTKWYPQGPRSFVDRRMALKRDVGLVRYAVRAYRGAIMRRDEDGKREYDHCGHAHMKPKVARACAEKEARRRNRELAKQATEEQSDGN